MRNGTFIKVALLIVLAGAVFYLATQKYTFDQIGHSRKNIHTGTVERYINGEWHKLGEPYKRKGKFLDNEKF